MATPYLDSSNKENTPSPEVNKIKLLTNSLTTGTFGRRVSSVHTSINTLETLHSDLRHCYELTTPTLSLCPDKLIPRPEGLGHQNLMGAMQLSSNPLKFEEICVTLCNATNRAALDPFVPWHYQPSEKVSRIIWIVRDHHPYLARFEDCWPAEELIKRNLEIRRQYLQTRNDSDNTTLPDYEDRLFDLPDSDPEKDATETG